MEKYNYILKSTGASSSKYGKCEVCGKHASEVFHQIETKDFFSFETNRVEQQHVSNTFGHEQCLINRQKISLQTTEQEQQNKLTTI